MFADLPSQIAAAATYLALKTTGHQPWTAELQHYADYTERGLLPVVRELLAYCRETGVAQSVGPGAAWRAGDVLAYGRSAAGAVLLQCDHAPRPTPF